MKVNKTMYGLIRRMVYAAVCLTLCMILPFLTGQVPQIGGMLSPMHIPVLLAGFLCGGPWAAAVGLVAPSLRYFLFGMPPLLPVGFAMTFELVSYGLVAGLLYRALPKTRSSVYTALIAAMMAGRLVWGAAAKIIYGAMGMDFTWELFLAGAFLEAIPGIILHIVLIPVLVLALRRAKVME